MRQIHVLSHYALGGSTNEADSAARFLDFEDFFWNIWSVSVISLTTPSKVTETPPVFCFRLWQRILINR